MKIINKARGTDKTWGLIKEASENNGVVVCSSKSRKKLIIDHANFMLDKGYIKTLPIIVDYPYYPTYEEKIYVDELDNFIGRTLGYNIDYATMTGEVEDYVESDNVSKNISKLNVNIKAKIDSSEMDELLDRYYYKLKEIDEITDKINEKKVSVGFEV